MASPRDRIRDDGAFAWLQCAGAFFLFFNSWGLVNTFGAYETFYEQSLLKDQSPSQVAWVGSLQAFLFVIGGAIAGPLYDHGHLSALVRGGSFLVVFGMMMTSLCSQYWQVLLAQGLVIGLGNGALFVPSIALLPTYFIKRKALSTGIAITGGNLGGVIYSIIFDKLEPRLGFPWATRLIAFIMLVTLALPVLCLRMRIKPSTARSFFDTNAWREPSFLLMTTACFVGFLGLYIPYFFIQSFAGQKDVINSNTAVYLLPIINAGSFVGRIILCYIADATGPVNILLLCALACAILSFAWISVASQAGIVVFGVLYGFFSGTYISLVLTTVAVWLCPSLEMLGLRIGMITIPCALGFLIGTPVAGAIAEHGWLSVQLFTGITLAASTLAILLLRAKVGGWGIAKRC